MTPARALVVLHVESASGPQRSLAPRLEHLREQGTGLTFLVPGPGSAARWAAELGDVITGLPGAVMLPSSPARAWRTWRALELQRRLTATAARDTGAELAVVSSPTMLGSLRGARKAGAATLLYCGEVLARGGIRGAGGGLLARAAARNADAIVAASRAVGRHYEGRGLPVTVINPPIAAPPAADELSRRGAAWRAAHGLDPDARVVAALGAITAGRGQDLLVRALANAPSGKPWTLVIGGGTYDRPRDREFAARLERLIAELGVADRARLIGAVDDPWALYAGADVFVNPARVPEGFGRASCEALAAGCPVVATRVGGVEEALRDGETALLVEPDSPAALGAAIARLLDNPSFARGLAEAGADDIARRLAPAAGQPAFEAAVDAALATAQSSSAVRGA